MVGLTNEIGLLKHLQSDHICRCYEAFDSGSRALIVTELMEANMTSLCEMSEGAAKYVMKETLKGLVFLHSRHIIHRDIKSDNILYNNEGSIKFCDFGTAV